MKFIVKKVKNSLSATGVQTTLEMESEDKKPFYLVKEAVTASIIGKASKAGDSIEVDDSFLTERNGRYSLNLSRSNEELAYRAQRRELQAKIAQSSSVWNQ